MPTIGPLLLTLGRLPLPACADRDLVEEPGVRRPPEVRRRLAHDLAEDVYSYPLQLHEEVLRLDRLDRQKLFNRKRSSAPR